MRSTSLAALAIAGVLVLSGSAAAVPAPGFTELVSVSTAGVQGDQDSQTPSISDDGRFVAFVSLAENLVAEDTNLATDVFVRDRLLGTTERVSVSSSGRQGNGNSGLLNLMGGPNISGDGRFVAFSSEASNLVRGDRNANPDVFVHDRLTHETTRVSVSSAGAEANAGGTEPDISRDGRFVSFLSFADNLVPDGNFTGDVYVHDRQTGVTERISQAPDGSDANGQSLFVPRLSEDGRFVYFSSFASNLVDGDPDNGDVDAYLFDRQIRTTTAITSNRPSSGVISHGIAGGISGDGRFLTFTTQDTSFIDPDTNGFVEDAWLVDRSTGAYVLVGRNDDGVQGDDSTFAGDVSDDGRFIALVSRATNFGGPTNFRENVYLRDRTAGTTGLVSVASDGTEGDLDSIEPAMTPDAGAIAFASRSSTFVPETQSTFAYDVFVRDMRPQADLSVTKTDSPDPVAARGQLTYTLTVRNDGPAAATGVTLVDTLPDAAFVSATTSQGSCARSGKGKADGVVTCELGGLVSGQGATVSIVVSPAREGTISNTATVRANEPDPNLVNNTATAETTVLPR
jgi:uncharacterized repeat protein (TIGR01451 family)